MNAVKNGLAGVVLLLGVWLAGCEESCPRGTKLSDGRCLAVEGDMQLGVDSEPDAAAKTQPVQACSEADALRCVASSRTEREQCVGGAWTAFTACEDGQACQSAKAGECVSTCKRGERTCRGEELYACNEALLDYELDEACALGCNAQRNQCNVCDAMQAPRCDGAATRVSCRADGSGEDREPCAAVCSRGECVECVDATQCSTADACQPKRCDTAAGRCIDSLAPKQTACGNGRYCDGTGACVECVDDSNCAGYEACVNGACSARPSLMFLGGENGSFQVVLSRGYSLRMSAQYSSTNTAKMRVEVAGTSNCSSVGAEIPYCTIPASNQDRTLTLTGPREICRKAPRISADQIILGFEDYKETDPEVADCLDPTVTLDATPEG
jgi:hypothetical protein